ncbi:serine/threonine-protein kinase [Gemmatimonas groenlandica]|uniref:non-specific serine/threonine protein kinase n=1 Tax=Gemmatimonas groenlandica TaxID=2732249 RepID=A0A6M4IGP5_9BACT|nr:serine/threonine-protein kinase [Gemmatimonas groenlandica]QJR34274.1 serine/threonine-protein kinase [Gemmatimonas groenlandica]
MPRTIAERLTSALAGRYVLERELGAGGMATVWLARDLRHDRAVALKVLRPELTAVLGAERFLDEIRLTARLDHPHILTLIDSGEADGLLFYVLPYVRGESLRARLDHEKQLPLDDAVRLVRQVASALAYAHSHGVVHRDIKPENILLHEGEAVVTDFGIALALREAGGTRLTESGLSLGTPQYMSPEQATGDRELDARSDVYSLGAVLYELITGDPPHAGTTVQAVIAKLLTEKPTSLRTLRNTVPDALEKAVFKALSKVPADRFTGANTFGDAIAAGLTQPERGSESPPSQRSLWKPMMLGVGIGLAVVTATWLLLGTRGVAATTANIPEAGVPATYFGDVLDFALSPDAQRLALGRLACPERGRCETVVEVRDVRGGISLPLARFLATYDMRWSRDGRYVDVTAADSTGRFGLFRVSSLGGPVAYLGLFGFAQSVGRTDSLFVGVSVSNFIRLGFLLPGETAQRDTASFVGLDAWAISPDAARIALVQQRGGQNQIRLVDRRWRTLDSLSVPEYYSQPRWSPPGDALLWVADANSDVGLRVVRVEVDRASGRFRGSPRAVTVPFDMPQSFSGRRLDIADDGTIAYVSGVTPRVLQLMSRTRAGTVPSVVRRIVGQTGRLSAFISPNGGTIAFTRLAAHKGSATDQLIAFDVAAGQEREISPPLQHFVDAVWTNDGTALIYASYEEGVGTRFTRWDRATDRRQLVGTYPGRSLNLISVMPDESLFTIGEDGASVEHLARDTGERVRRFPLPGGQAVTVLVAAPDGTDAATMSWTASGDSLVIGSLDLRSGAWKEFTRLFAEGTGTMRWLAEGSVEFTITSSVSASELYRLDPRRGTVTRLGELAVPFASYNFSRDGRWATAVERRVVSNVYLVRPR